MGWAWLDHRRAGSVVERSDAGSRVRLDGIAPDGSRASFEATVEVARLVPVPDCGKPPSAARKSEPELASATSLTLRSPRCELGTTIR